RLGLTGAFQFQATDNLRFSLDLLYGKMNNDRDELHIQHATGTSTGMGCYQLTTGSKSTNTCAKVTSLTYNSLNEVTAYGLQNTTLTSESDKETANTDIHQGVFNVDWRISDRLRLTGLVGHEDTDFIDNKAKVYMIVTGDMSLDFTRGFMGHNTYFFDATDPSKYLYSDFNIWQPKIKNKFDNAKFDLAYDFTNNSMLSAGVSAKRYGNEFSAPNPDYASLLNAGTVSRTIDPSLTYVDPSHPDNRWLSTSVQGVFDKIGLKRWLDDVANKDKVTEDDGAAYIQYAFHDLPLPIGTLRGQAGVRQYLTRTTATGPVGATEVSISRHYSGLLPAMSLAWAATPHLVLRASASNNVSRPDLGALDPSGSVQNDPNKGQLTIAAGNPDLKPMTSTNLDLGAEYYFGKKGYVSLALFSKRMQNLLGSELKPMRYGDTGYPLSFLGAVDENGAAQTANTTYWYSRPINLNSAKVEGFEVAFQRDFDFLPGPLKNLGLLANWSHVLGKTLYVNIQGSGVNGYKAFSGLSKDTATAALYYETPKWGARVSAAYRSHYILAVQAGNTDEDERGFHDTTFVDFTAHYNVNEKLKLTFDMLNLTNQPYEEYSDTDNRLYSTTKSGVIYSLKATYAF
ncbi:MAG: TonB-dependent receptor, partial [Phenylobacterium sp.]